LTVEARSRTVDILSIYVPAFFIFLGMGIVSPILAIYAETFNVTYALVSFAISMYAIGRFIADIPVGVLADRYGRKPLMIIGTIILAICSFLNATAVEFWQFLLYRLLEGVGAAMWITSRQALLADILRPEERGRVLSYFSSFMLIGSAAGPTVGGLVASTWNIRAPFYIYTVVSIISLVLTVIFIHDTKIVHTVHGSGGPAFSMVAVKKILSKTNFIMASVATFTMFFLTAGVRDMIIPLYAANVVQLDKASIGYILSFATVINLLLTIPIGYMIDSQGRKSVILKSLFVTSGACLVFSFTNSFWTMAAAAIILGIGTSGAQQAPQAMATDVTIDDPHGLSMGLYRVFGDVGFIVGPTILGFLADAFGLTVPFYFMAVLLFINGVLVLKVATETFALKKMKKSETPAPVG
jgi:DHA1 family multidrug resistance protein-like MFS transporter